jgi:hypothetical protein
VVFSRGVPGAGNAAGAGFIKETVLPIILAIAAARLLVRLHRITRTVGPWGRDLVAEVRIAACIVFPWVRPS